MKVNPMERGLDSEKLTKTADKLAKWIGAEFPDAHLAIVATEVHSFAHEAVARARNIRRPIWFLRVGTWIVILLAMAGCVHQLINHPLREILEFLDATKGAGAYLAAILLALVTLEIRWKRRRAITAVNELRALVHIVDMHQLAKDPVIATFRDDSSQLKIDKYLHACAALLALLSKVGQLYVEHFPDPTATSAVNDFEMITNGLSNKIWLKILDMNDVVTTLRPVPTSSSTDENKLGSLSTIVQPDVAH